LTAIFGANTSTLKQNNKKQNASTLNYWKTSCKQKNS